MGYFAYKSNAFGKGKGEFKIVIMEDMPKEQELTGYPSIDKPWLKYYSKEQIATDLPDKSIYEYMLEMTQKYSSKYVVNYFGKRVRYAQFLKNIDFAGGALRSYGIGKGDVVSICSLGTPEVYYLFYAINKIGAISNFVAVNDTNEEKEKKIRTTNSKLVFTIDLAEESILNATEEMNIPIITIPIWKSMPFPIALLVKRKMGANIKQRPNTIAWSTFLKEHQNVDTDTELAQDPNQIALIEYTSGTTGESKGVLHTNYSANSIVMNYGNLGSMMKHEQGDRFLNCIPPFLAYGIFVGMHMPICLGMEVVICPNPDADEFVKSFLKYKPNHFAGGALHIDKLMANPKVQKMDLSFLRTAAFGGDSVTDVWIERVNRFLKEHGCQSYMARGYGMTEVAGTFATSNQTVEKLLPFPTNNVMVRDVDSDEELKIGQEGELYISGPSMMVEYYNHPEETRETITRFDGTDWIRTGDLGYVTEAGELVISGRLKRIYWTMAEDGVGYRVYPMKIENVISQHDNVASVAVVGVKHPERAYLSIAYIKLKNPSESQETIIEIQRMCEEHLNKNSIPYRYEVVENLPVTKAGKVDYKALEKMVV